MQRRGSSAWQQRAVLCEIPTHHNREWVYVDAIAEGEFIEFFRARRELLFKPSGGKQGNGIFKCSYENENGASDIYRKIRGDGYIAEEVLHQAKELAALNASSVNTIRVISVKKGDTVSIMNAAIRIGQKGSVTDNFSSRGVIADINLETGIVTSRAVTKDGKTYYNHPETGAQITGLNTPSWDLVMQTVKEAHMGFRHLGYIAWDVVVTEDYRVTIIEGNTYGGMNTQQFPSLKGMKPAFDRLMKA